MSSTFYGLDIAKSGLVASQLALDVTSNNVSNVGTDGYTRQGVDQTSVSSSGGAFRYANTSVQSGKGVSVNSVTQYRDSFLDLRYRNAESTFNTYNTNFSVLSSVKGIFDETSNDGLINSLQGFYTSLENLSGNSGDVSYASLARSSAKTVTGMLNQYANQLSQISDEQETNLTTSLTDVNSYIQKISVLNQNIAISKQNGSDCNSLLDERNLDLDKLSGYINISVEDNSNGTVSVKCGSSYLLDAVSGTATTLSADTSSGMSKVVDGGGTEFDISDGSIKGILQNLNGQGSYAPPGGDNYYGIAYYQKALNEIASTFASTYNNLNGSNALFTTSDLSGSITASNISVSSAWLSDASLINTGNITNMISALKNDVSFSSGFTGSFEEFATELMSENATDASYNKEMKTTYSSIVNTITDQREAISGVSTDEEAINTTKYQKAFQASARVISALDEMLDKLINNTGVVGL